MTSEEAIKEISEIIFELGFEEGQESDKKADALNMAIKALEQEPCEDCISREYILSKAHCCCDDLADDEPCCVDVDDIKEAPSVQPKPKTGHWIPVSERLPEKNMACLVAVGKFNLTQIAMYSDLMGTIDHRIFYQGDVGHDNFENITEYVKAWMPLPEPYKAESEG